MVPLAIVFPVMMVLITSLLQRPYFIEAGMSQDLLKAINDCTCPGYDALYECTVTGGIATVWKGTAFNCQSAGNEIVLLHNTNFTSLRAESCNSGAITGYIIKAENGTYTSQLIVSIRPEMNGSTIVCANDTGVNTSVIDSKWLTITNEPFPTPTDIKIVEANHIHLSFNWSQVSMNCPRIYYSIMASNCGECPEITTNNKVTCTGNYIQLLNNHQCSFAVQTIVCDEIIGDVSTAINVTNQILGNPNQAENDSRLTVQLVIAAVVISTVVLMGITLILGLVFVYLILKKSNGIKNTTNQRSVLEGNMVEMELGTPDNNQDQVQYKVIRHSEESTHTGCAGPSGNETLDSLLILLKEEVSPRWYEFGLVVGVPKEVMDNYSGYPSDQCLIELLDYWLRHHHGQLKWKEVGSALEKIKLYQLAEKVLQITTTGKLSKIIDPEIDNDFNLHQSSNLAIDNIHSPQVSFHTSVNDGDAKVILAPEHEDTAELQPPPVPPKKIDTK